MALFIYFNLLWFLAGLLTGITSFGGNLLAIPLIALALPPREAILYGCLSGGAIFLEISLLYFRHILWRETIFLSISAFCGVPFGIWFLAHAGPAALLLAAGITICLFLAWQFFAPRRGAQKPLAIYFCLPFGFCSGMMMAAVGMGGPALVLYAFLRQWQKEQTMGTVNMISVFIMLLALYLQHSAGMFSAELLKMGGIGAIFAFVGILASLPILHRINIQFFRKLLLAMLSFSAAILLARGIMAL